MLNYLCLIVKPNSKLLDNNLINFCKKLIINYDNSILDENWLEKSECYEILFESNDLIKTKLYLRSKMPQFVDLVFIKNKNRKKKLLIADMDSTIIKEETLDEIARSIGIYDKISNITNLAMQGKIDFASALKERVAYLKGTSLSNLRYILENKISLNDGAETLVKTMKRNECKMALVSGGFSFFANEIAKMLGFDYVISNRLEIKNNNLTGKLIEPIVDKEAKKNTLLELSKKNNINLDNTIALGDGSNDLSMIKKAGYGVGFRAKPQVEREADANITNGDLTSVLFIQGYKKSNFKY
ncbi:MAG: Phosphoserine phosphatase [Alphaproteobacteria bacterium MarineAlpha2_Bin1]|nr:MAG: Phosphoserine phosphatase [Alphaproteobacteria bacterium MarineAlpha2_Bin1]